MNILSDKYVEKEDLELLKKSLEGSKKSLEKLICKHQSYIYNIALKMVLSKPDAEDITQEIIIKIITNLSKFRGESSFRTWIYRITVNYILNVNKKSLEIKVQSFSNYEKTIKEIPSSYIAPEEEIVLMESIQEAKFTCLAGMLICLSREKRIVYILGEFFGVTDKLGAEILEISKESYRKRLSRARKELYSFMEQQCGISNYKNDCSCKNKVKSFVESNWFEQDKDRKADSYKMQMKDLIKDKNEGLSNIDFDVFKKIQRQQPFYEQDFSKKIIKGLLNSNELKNIFEL